MRRRKVMPAELVPAWEQFQEQAERVEQARQALLSCLPVGRVDPVPVPVGLDVLRDELSAVAPELARWRRPEVEADWLRCGEAVELALRRVGPAKRTAERTGELEELLDAVTEVVEPLDAWHDAERRWLRLRTKR